MKLTKTGKIDFTVGCITYMILILCGFFWHWSAFLFLIPGGSILIAGCLKKKRKWLKTKES